MDKLAEDKEQRRQELAQVPDQSSLGNWAVAAYQTQKQAEERESRRKAEEQLRLRAVWIERYMFSESPRVTAIFAEHMDIAPDHPALQALHWEIDPASIQNATFTENAAGEVSIHSASADFRLRTRIEDVPLEAKVSYVGEKPFMILSATRTMGTQGIPNMHTLGEVISEARRKRSEQATGAASST